MKSKINFQFPNQVSPRYIQPVFLKLESGAWYSSVELRELLKIGIPNIEGKEIIYNNMETWSLIGLGNYKVENTQGRKAYFRLTDLGKQIKETYSTNHELFFELMHYLFYSSWKKSLNPKLGKLWLYSRVCEILWDTAPSEMDSLNMTGILQQEAQEVFPAHSPKFPVQGVRAVFPWLVTLTPPFLSKKTGRSLLLSEKRKNCSPQLFHLALDLIYNQKQLKYGTSMAIGDEEIKSVCRVCLLDEGQFWEMADRTKMIIRGVDIRRGQFSTSIALEMKPQWIDLPDYTNEIEFDGFEGEEE